MKKNIFRKVVMLIVFLLAPILVLYSYSYQVSLDVVNDEMKSRNLDRISIFLNQIDSQMNELSYFMYSLSVDTDITRFKARDLYSVYSALEINQRIMEKIKLHGALSNWTNQITVFFPKKQDVIALDYRKYDESYWSNHFTPVWKIDTDTNNNQYFMKHIMLPYNSKYDVNNADVIIEAKYSLDHAKNLFDQMTVKDTEDVFLFHSGEQPFTGRTANKQSIQQIVTELESLPLHEKGNVILKINKQDYLVSYMKSQATDWMLVDYVQLKDILSPIYKSKNLFYISIFLLLVLSVILALLIYRYVHIPIRKLIESMKKIELGDYKTRLVLIHNDEFGYVFNKFNLMVETIQKLIEEVFEEKLRSNQAMMKQLQAQINPHFLYNCLSFIKSKSKLDMKDAVQAMVMHLGEFYRYTTYLEKQHVSLREEISFITNYLEIHVLRMKRITYRIEIPEAMLDATIPRLSIQPIVENAIVHGIEVKEGAGYVHIYGHQTPTHYQIMIEDNGIGVSAEAIGRLNQKINMPTDETESCGLWNVNQRLKYYFGEEAGLSLRSSLLGGLCVQLRWSRTNEDQAR